MHYSLYLVLFPWYSALSPSVFSLSPFWSHSLVRLQKSVSFLTVLGDFSCSLPGNGFWTSSPLCFSFSVSLGKPNCILVRLYLCQSNALYFFEVVNVYFWFWILNISCLFLKCEQALIPRLLSVFSGRRRQWLGPADSAWLLGSQQKKAPAGRRYRLLLVAGPWEVVICSRLIYQVSRELHNSSSRVCEFPVEWEQKLPVFNCSALSWGDWNHRWCLFRHPNWNRPCLSLESVISVISCSHPL